MRIDIKPNYNEKRQRPYGVIALNNCWTELWDEFLNDGVDLRFEAFRQEVRDSLRKLFDISDGVLDDMVDIVMDGASDCDLGPNSEEAPRELKNSNYELLLDYVGGAPLVWVTDSEWVCSCRPCSPCVLGAGDLDNPDPEDMDMAVLCFAPDDMHCVALLTDKVYIVHRLGIGMDETWIVRPSGKTRR